MVDSSAHAKVLHFDGAPAGEATPPTVAHSANPIALNMPWMRSSAPNHAVDACRHHIGTMTIAAIPTISAGTSVII